ncbi:MAG: bifunctional (p)ppGpp synthetase/guanosine-3',5'-bis(diphosphate) 3'-pyrophosphohydrolase [Chloroflexota bacterium]|nr:MAG: bifunctional (p)ppGpp synthetase/guanosine-3',5'-bis(diphosphate) 3'-pyrophosphohydrolase [Chloroflexota bacterium]
MSAANLLDKVRTYLPPDKIMLVEKALAFAKEAHGAQVRLTGEPYLEHPIQTAMTLAELQLDGDAIAAALLHDVPEDCGVPMLRIEREFGPDVARLVDGVTKLARIASHAHDERFAGRGGTDDTESRAENLRKMLLAMAEDIRVVLIKLADRLHNMRTLAAHDARKRQTIARETMEIYAPLAHRLGIWQIKWQLEDLSFRHMEPERYKEIAHLLASRRTSRERYVNQVIRILETELENAGVKAEVSGRPKHIFSIHKKMQRYALVGRDFSQIYDLLAVRILVPSVPDCYSVLGVIHNLWHPIPGQFDDYIATPKESMYQSLHTSVIGPGGKPLEIQIRTYDMHRLAEYGIAAHWRYKEGSNRRDQRFEEKVAWLRQLMEWHNDLTGASEFVETVKTDIFRDWVFVYTPRGDIKDLPANATPLDFAYKVHTDLGHRCIGAKVNGRLVSLSTPLQNGDIVEVITSKSARGPSRDWLNPALGFVKTSHAKEKVRQWFRKQERAENVERGREMLEKELRRLALDHLALDDLAKLFKYDRVDDFMAAIGIGEVTTHQIAMRLAVQEEKPVTQESLVTRSQGAASSIRVMGVGDLLTQLARCCNPVPGDGIVGYITRSRGVTVHRHDCHNIRNSPDKERQIPVEWSLTTKQFYPVPVRIEAWDRVGLIRDISTLVSEEKVNMSYVNTVVNGDSTATISLTLETTGIGQLSKVLSRLEGIRGVINVMRDAAAPSHSGVFRVGSGKQA